MYIHKEIKKDSNMNNIIKTLLLMTTLTCAKPLVSNSNFIYFGSNLSDDKFYLDENSIGHRNNDYWASVVKISSTGVQDNIIIYDVDCKLNVISTSPTYTNWTKVNANTVGAGFRNYVCASWDVYN